MTDIRVSIEVLEETAADSATCIVRILAGVLSLGDTFDTATFGDGAEHAVNLRVVDMWRYADKPANLIEPPHAARLRLTGSGAQVLAGAALLSGTCTEARVSKDLS